MKNLTQRTEEIYIYDKPQRYQTLFCGTPSNVNMIDSHVVFWLVSLLFHRRPLVLLRAIITTSTAVLSEIPRTTLQFWSRQLVVERRLASKMHRFWFSIPLRFITVQRGNTRHPKIVQTKVNCAKPFHRLYRQIMNSLGQSSYKAVS